MKYLLFLLFFSCQKSYILSQRDFTLNLDIELYSLLDKKTCIIKDLAKKHKGIVLFFWQNSCPCVKRYQKRIIALWENYKDKDMAFYFVASNKNEDDEEIIKEYNKRQIKLDILRDKEGFLAQMLKAKTTPTSVLIDQNGNISFMGWIDNERNPKESGYKAYLKNAIDELLAKKAISIPTSPMFGCPII